MIYLICLLLHLSVLPASQNEDPDLMRVKERLDAREKLSKSETELSKNIYERGVDEKGFAIIRSKGDKALFGGINTLQMKKKLNIPKTT